MNTFNLLNIYFYKITELRKFCIEFNLATNGTKTNIIDRILQYYLINTHTRKSKLCDNMRCKTCFDNSFLSNDKSMYWDYTKNNIIDKEHPRYIFKGNSNNKYWFIYNKCNHNFDILLGSITVKFKNSNKLFRYDFYLTDYNIIIELDGIQHFEFVKHFKNNFKLNQYKDCYKMKFAINNINNVKIIRISQEDVYKNKINYKELLQQLLNTNTLNNNVLQQITYISADTNLYDKHTQYMKLNITELNF